MIRTTVQGSSRCSTGISTADTTMNAVSTVDTEPAYEKDTLPGGTGSGRRKTQRYRASHSPIS